MEGPYEVGLVLRVGQNITNMCHRSRHFSAA